MEEILLHARNDSQFMTLYNQRIVGVGEENPEVPPGGVAECYAFFVHHAVSEEVYTRLRNEMIVRNIMGSAISLAYIVNPRFQDVEIIVQPDDALQGMGMEIEVHPLEWLEWQDLEEPLLQDGQEEE